MWLTCARRPVPKRGRDESFGDVPFDATPSAACPGRLDLQHAQRSRDRGIVLRSWRKAQLEEHLLVGRRDDDDALVFAQPDGSPIHPDYFSQVFERHMARSELPLIRLHDLRHTHATILLQAGVPVKVVSERLGHSSPAFTMTVYQHVLPGMQADAAKAFSDAAYGKGKPSEPRELAIGSRDREHT
jgi:integrase